jgi:tetratricopeptide (TPR) repeat protein
MLATSLSASPRIALITPDQLERGLSQPSAATIAHRDALRAAQGAGAQAMITGAFTSLGETIRVDSQLYDVASGRLLGGESLTVTDPKQMLRQFDRFAAQLAVRLGAPVTGQTNLDEVMTNNLEAYRLYSLGLDRTREYRLPEAIELYEKAVAMDPGFAMAYARIGFTYSSSWGRAEVGKPYLEKAYRLSDRLAPRDRMLIRAWYALACRDYEAAERHYRAILSAFPLERDTYYGLARLILAQGRVDEGRNIIQRGLAVEPDNPHLHNLMTAVYFERGETEKAIESAQRYVSLTGEPNAYDTLATAYQRAGRYDEARNAYLEAMRRKPDFDIAINHFGNLCFQLGRYREALNQFREYTRIAPSDDERVRGHLVSSWVYWRKGDLANAEREAAEAARLKAHDLPQRLLIEADRGNLRFTDDLRREVLDFSTQTDRGTPGNQRNSYFIAGYVALRDHKTDEALSDFRAVLRQPGVSWSIDPLETCLGDAFLELGRFDDAIAEYQRVLRLNPNYPMARYRLGLALDRKGLGREARAEFQRFLSIWKDADPDIPEYVDARRRCSASGADI